MRAFHLLPASLIFGLAIAIQLPDLQPFLAALPNVLQDYLPQNVQNATAHELLKRQYSNTCPTNFANCAALGAPGLCCMSNARCSADQAGNVACCPTGAVCTGTIGGVITAGTMDTNGVLAGGGATGTETSAQTTSFQMASSTTANNGLVAATTQTTAPPEDGGQTGNGGFIVAGSSTVATPGAAIRGAQMPFVAQAIIRALEFLPL